MSDPTDHALRVLVGPRQCGKTTAIVAWLLDAENRVVLVSDKLRRKALLDRAGLDAKSNRVALFAGWRPPMYGPRVEVGIDDLDSCLHMQLQQRASFVAMTGQVEGVALFAGVLLSWTDVDGAGC